MLIFFIHGVTVRNASYAKELQEAIAQRVRHARFKQGFWGDVLNPLEDGTLWSNIETDLHHERQRKSVNEDDIFRYKEIRKAHISPFIIDLLSYLGPFNGKAIRAKLAHQLQDFHQRYPEENDLHIVCHSMGTVILWDCLFNSRFEANDPAFQIRRLLGVGTPYGNRASSNTLTLKSVTTMGSPILYVNTMLGIVPETIRRFADQNSRQKLNWLNIIHASDVIAYPLKASLKMDSSWNLQFRDLFINSNISEDKKKIEEPFDPGKWWDSAKKTALNMAEETARTKLGNNAIAMALSQDEAHNCYWQHNDALNAILELLTESSNTFASAA